MDDAAHDVVPSPNPTYLIFTPLIKKGMRPGQQQEAGFAGAIGGAEVAQ